MLTTLLLTGGGKGGGGGGKGGGGEGKGGGEARGGAKGGSSVRGDMSNRSRKAPPNQPRGDRISDRRDNFGPRGGDKGLPPQKGQRDRDDRVSDRYVGGGRGARFS